MARRAAKEGLEQRVVEEGTENEDIDAEIRAETEQEETEAEKRESLVQRLEQDKYCGGLFLKNFPEGAGEKKTEVQEALLTVV